MELLNEDNIPKPIKRFKWLDEGDVMFGVDENGQLITAEEREHFKQEQRVDRRGDNELRRIKMVAKISTHAALDSLVDYLDRRGK